MSNVRDFPLGIGQFKFSDLYEPSKLKGLHTEFWKFAGDQNAGLRAKYDNTVGKVARPEESEVLVETAKVLGDFIGRLFNVSTHEAKLKKATLDLAPVFRFKKDFLNIRVFKRLEEQPISPQQFKELDKTVRKILSNDSTPHPSDEELTVAQTVLFILDCETKLKAQKPLDTLENQRLQSLCLHLAGSSPTEKAKNSLQSFEDWCVQLWVDPERRASLKNWASFVRAAKIEYENLVEVVKPDPRIPEKMIGPDHALRCRDGFKLTDNRMNSKQVLREIDYCIIC
ncbi:MAG: hypothetical protein HYR96_01465, partial [Deltaproteobacteria bacterium]|nr:hypothetical protein [Deltaproteobacteria bacterium]